MYKYAWVIQKVNKFEVQSQTCQCFEVDLIKTDKVNYGVATFNIFVYYFGENIRSVWFNCVDWREIIHYHFI